MSLSTVYQTRRVLSFCCMHNIIDYWFDDAGYCLDAVVPPSGSHYSIGPEPLPLLIAADLIYRP